MRAFLFRARATRSAHRAGRAGAYPPPPGAGFSRRKALFLADLKEGTGLAGDNLNGALLELVAAGLVTNDSLQALRQVLAWSSEQGAPDRAPLSSLEAQLSAWRQGHGPVLARPDRGRLRAAKKVVTARLERAAQAGWPGRWSLVHRFGVWGKEAPCESGWPARRGSYCTALGW